MNILLKFLGGAVGGVPMLFLTVLVEVLRGIILNPASMRDGAYTVASFALRWAVKLTPTGLDDAWVERALARYKPPES